MLPCQMTYLISYALKRRMQVLSDHSIPLRLMAMRVAISARMLKSTATAIAPSITKLFNQSIQHSCIPRCWKAVTVPVPKKQGASSPNDISLLPILSKVLERHIHFLITEHICNHSPLSKFQFGFQHGKSAVSALLSVTHDWLMHLEKRQEVGAEFFISVRPLTVSRMSL